VTAAPRSGLALAALCGCASSAPPAPPPASSAEITDAGCLTNPLAQLAPGYRAPDGGPVFCPGVRVLCSYDTCTGRSRDGGASAPQQIEK
jgi:hypothetical protein